MNVDSDTAESSDQARFRIHTSYLPFQGTFNHMCHLQVTSKLLLLIQHCTDTAFQFIKKKRSTIAYSGLIELGLQGLPDYC